MVVRVRVRLKALKGEKGKTIEDIALLNAGYESKNPEMVIPVNIAEKLGLWPKLPEGTEVEDYEVAGGTKIRIHYIEDCLETQVITEDKDSEPVKVPAVILEGEKEILASDKWISAQKIVLDDVGKGIWKFRGEEKRRSEKST